MTMLNLVLLQISNKSTELVENSFKILKCQRYYTHDLLKLLFQMKKKHGNVFKYFLCLQ